MFRKQILAQLRKANPGVPEKVLGLLADKLVAKVTAEDQIEGEIAELVENMPITIKEFADFVQREGDRRVTEANTKKVVTSTNKEEGAGGDEEPTTEFGKLAKMIETLAGTVNGLVKEKSTDSIKTQMEAKLAEKKIPTVLLKGRVPETAEEMETVLAEIEGDWAVINPGATSTTTKKLGSFKAPVSSDAAVGGDDETVDPDVTSYMKRKMEAANLQTSK